MRALADVAVGEATDKVRSVHDGLKELHVLAGNRVKAAGSASLGKVSAADELVQLYSWRAAA